MEDQRNEQADVDLRDFRVREPWPVYDTIRIRESFPQAVQDEGYRSYADLAQADTISLFASKRKRSTVGEAFSNLDLDGQLSYGIKIYSIGIGFEAPSCSTPSEIGPDQEAIESTLFQVDIPRLCGVVLRVNQDDKLVNRVALMPLGQGVTGISAMTEASGLSVQSMEALGAPMLPNRWGAITPLKVPRLSTLNIEIRMSREARELLSHMRGPGYWSFRQDDGSEVLVAKTARIVADMIVERDAMLREGYDVA